MRKAEGMPEEEYIIRIENADVVLDGREVLRRVSWRLGHGQQWAVTGRNGSGKSTFLKLIHGEVSPWPGRGKVSYRLDGDQQDTPLGIHEHIACVTPELQDAYIRNGWDMTGEEVIHTGFFHSIWLHERPAKGLTDVADELMMGLGIDGLREKSILAMSRGEARKVLIARALVAGPRVLLLDEICDGLDAASRENVLSILEQMAKGRTQIIYATHRPEELIPSISHVLFLKEGRVYSAEERCGDSPVSPSACPQREEPEAEMPAMTAFECCGDEEEYLVRIANASVYVNDQRVLDGVDWQMAKGENWAVLGKNGSGKSTLLKVAYGGLHPALGGSVDWFGGRGGESLWEVRKRIGYVSSELQALYDDDLTGEEVVISGLFASRGLYRKVSRGQRAKVRELIETLGIERLGRKKVGRMSYGEMRKVLVARALSNDPDILILDEPCSGLDSRSRKDFREFMEGVARSGTGIVMAVHHRDELIPSITHVLTLEDGRVAGHWKRQEVAPFLDRRAPIDYINY